MARKRRMFDIGPEDAASLPQSGAVAGVVSGLKVASTGPLPSEHMQNVKAAAAAAASSLDGALAVAKMLAEKQASSLGSGDVSSALPAKRSKVLEKDRERAMHALERNLEIVARKEQEHGVMEVDEDDEEPSTSSRSKVRVMPTSRAGVGAKGSNKGIVPASVKTAAQENSSCYISGLPVEYATETAVERMFAAHGRVKRVKIYVDKLTDKAKGDALVSFAKAGSARQAIAELDGAEVAPGVRLSVQAATFHSEAALSGGPIAKPADEDWPAVDASGLPGRCRAVAKPVVVLRHLYDPAQCRLRPARDFLDELEGEIAAECARFGRVVECYAPATVAKFQGAVAVTFDDVKSAELCASAMAGRWFDQVQIVVERLGNWDDDVVEPLPPLPPIPENLAPPHSTVVLIRNAFNHVDLVNGGPDFLPELETEIRQECCKFGPVLSVGAMPSEPALAGCVIVAFGTHDAFELCRTHMDGRWFDYRKLKIEKYEPPENHVHAEKSHASAPAPAADSAPQLDPASAPAPAADPAPQPQLDPSSAPSLDEFFRDIQEASAAAASP